MTHTIASTSSAGPSGGAEDRVSRIVHYSTIWIALLFLCVTFIWAVVAGRPASTDFHFNPFALFSIISFISNVVALTLISRIKIHTTSLLWFSLHLLSLAAWAAGECLGRLSDSTAAAAFWSPSTTLGAVIMPISLYMFVLSYTDSRRSQQPLVFLTLISVSLFLIFCDFRTKILTDYDPHLMVISPWGYVTHTGPLYLIITLWLVLITSGALLLLYRFRRRTIETTLRRQALLFMIAISIPLIGGGITDGLLPGLNLVIFPPMSVTLLTVMGLIISYGILRYRFFSFTPSVVAGQILSTMNEAVIGIKPDMHINYVNGGAERLLGLAPDKIAKKRLSDFLSQELSAAQFKQTLLDTMGNGDFGTLESINLRKSDGTTVTVKLSVTSVRGEGNSYGYIIVLTDITQMAQTAAIIERQVAEQTKTIRDTKAKLDSSINSLEFGFLITNAKPEITMLNHAAHDLFCGKTDHTPENCTSVTLSRIQAEFGAAAPFIHTITGALAAKHSKNIEQIPFRHRVMRVFVSPVIDGQSATGTAIIIQDITEEQILSRSRDEFFSIASHELRTPLTAIKGNAAMMIDYYPEAIKEPTLHEMVYDIRESSVRLIGIVNDFLDASRLEQGRVTYKFEQFLLPEVAEKIIYEMSETAKQKKIYLRLGPGLHQDGSIPPVIADIGRVKQILYNLIGNASKFTDTGGITIDAAVAGTHVKISVTDTGHGIAADMQQLLFHKFQQAGDSLITRDGSKGTGLGLYISQLLAKGMDGDVALEKSEPGVGSTFSVTLPIATPKLVERLTQSQTSTDSKTGLTTNSQASSRKTSTEIHQ